MDDSYPACRYCQSQKHTSQEFEQCARSYQEFFGALANKRLGDCNLSDVLLRLQALCPRGFNFACPLTENLKAGSDVNILVFGDVARSFQMSRFTTYFLENVINTAKEEASSQAHHVINPTGGFKDETK